MALFDPISLRGLSIANRVVVSPMCQYSAREGHACDWHLAHWAQLAQSGAGLVVIEATAVAREGRITHGFDVSSAGVSPGQQIESKPGLHVPFARAVRGATGVTTMVVGLVTEPAQAEAIVANADADLVALARGILANPRWPWHAAKALGATVAVAPQYVRGAPAAIVRR